LIDDLGEDLVCPVASIGELKASHAAIQAGFDHAHRHVRLRVIEDRDHTGLDHGRQDF
jgi:hypothetical protein